MDSTATHRQNQRESPWSLSQSPSIQSEGEEDGNYTGLTGRKEGKRPATGEAWSSFLHNLAPPKSRVRRSGVTKRSTFAPPSNMTPTRTWISRDRFSTSVSALTQERSPGTGEFVSLPFGDTSPRSVGQEFVQSFVSSRSYKRSRHPSTNSTPHRPRRSATGGSSRRATSVATPATPRSTVSTIEPRGAPCFLSCIESRSRESHAYPTSKYGIRESAAPVTSTPIPEDIGAYRSIAAPLHLQTVRHAHHHHHSCVVIFCKRKHFNEGAGNELVSNVSSKADLPTLPFLCLSSAAALLKHIENECSTTFAKRTLAVSFRSAEGHMMLDVNAACSLELLVNSRTGGRLQCLFAAVNNTVTPGGARLLKATLLQPLVNVPTIKLRQDCIEELLSLDEGETLEELRQLLSKVPDVDAILSHMAQVPKVQSPKLAARLLNDIISLRTALSVVDDLARCLGQANNALFKTVRRSLEDGSALDVLREQIDRVISVQTLPKSKKRSALERNQLAFHIRSGIHALLDVARQTNQESIEDIYELANAYAKDWSVNTLQVKYTASKGYFLNAKNADVKKIRTRIHARDTPEEEKNEIRENSVDEASSHLDEHNDDDSMINETSSRGTTSFTTPRIESLNTRNKQSMNDINLLAERVLAHLQSEIREQMGWLLAFSEGVSLIDMLQSFAEMVATSTSTFCKPDLAERRELAIQAGRSILAEKHQDKVFVTNDAFLTPSANMVVIQGPNMAGKTTYLKMAAHIAILAQCGAFVPAAYVQTPVFDRLFTKFGADDSEELNLSAFGVEMSEAALIVEDATSRSLILIDELGRGTSCSSGLAISWAVCEQLAATGSFTLVTTHYPTLGDLETFYPNVRNQHMEVVVGQVCKAAVPSVTPESEKSVPAAGSIKYLYKCRSGRQPPQTSTIASLARSAGFPNKVLEDLAHVKRVLDDRRAAENLHKGSGSGSYAVANEWTRVCQRVGEVVETLRHSSLEPHNLSSLICKLRSDLQEHQRVHGPMPT